MRSYVKLLWSGCQFENLTVTSNLMTQQHLDQANFIQQSADAIIRRGWRGPVLVLLEAGRPLAFVGGQLLWLMQPLAALVGSTQRLQQTAHLLEDATAVDALIARLEEE